MNFFTFWRTENTMLFATRCGWTFAHKAEYQMKWPVWRKARTLRDCVTLLIGMRMFLLKSLNMWTNLESWFLLVPHPLDSVAGIFRANQAPRRATLFLKGPQNGEWLDLAESLVGNEKVEELCIMWLHWNAAAINIPAFIYAIGTMPNRERCTFSTAKPLQFSENDDASILKQIRNFRCYRLKGTSLCFWNQCPWFFENATYDRLPTDEKLGWKYLAIDYRCPWWSVGKHLGEKHGRFQMAQRSFE